VTTLCEKIKKLYPELTDVDFSPITGTIVINDEGAGEYIADWKHLVLSKPTQDQLAQLDKILNNTVPARLTGESQDSQ
jgi:hypothetical protein